MSGRAGPRAFSRIASARLGLGVAALVFLKPRQVVEARGHVGVKLRALPEHGGEAVKELRRGRQVQVTGILPTGWLQVSEEGEPVGWVFKTAVATETLAAATPGAARPTAVGDAAPEV